MTQLVTHERIKTTVPKAKELKRWTDRLVTVGKGGTEHHRRQACKILRDTQSVDKLMYVIAPRYVVSPVVPVVACADD